MKLVTWLFPGFIAWVLPVVTVMSEKTIPTFLRRVLHRLGCVLGDSLIVHRQRVVGTGFGPFGFEGSI